MFRPGAGFCFGAFGVSGVNDDGKMSAPRGAHGGYL